MFFKSSSYITIYSNYFFFHLSQILNVCIRENYLPVKSFVKALNHLERKINYIPVPDKNHDIDFLFLNNSSLKKS